MAQAVDADYTIRKICINDIDSLLALMKPFIDSGVLLPRTKSDILAKLDDYVVAVTDNVILGEMALHQYDDNTGELAAVVINPAFEHQGVGGVLMEYIINKARAMGLNSLFLLTRGDPTWYKKFGFAPDSIESIPSVRRAKWDPARGSKVFRLCLK